MIGVAERVQAADPGSAGRAHRGPAGRGEPVLELDSVIKHYPGTPPVEALRGVDLRIDRGELVAIVGPSGSGKSTLMNVIGTLDRPTGGEVRIDGVSAASLSDAGLTGLRAARIGFVFQQFHLLDTTSALENVATGLLYRGVPRRQRRPRATEALQRVGLGHRIDHKPSKLSGGERQRVAIARAIVGEPAIVLADEPTGNLDTKTSASIVSLLHGLHAEGSTIAIITHDPELARDLPRQVTIVDGRITEDTGDGSTDAPDKPPPPQRARERGAEE